MVWWGILSLLTLTGMGAAVYFAGGITTAWQALGSTINDICQDKWTCNLGFILLFKIFPFVILAIFALFLWEKRTKFHSPRPGMYFTHMTFGPNGVLLERTSPGKNIFFPYKETSLHLSANARMVYTKYGSSMRVYHLEFTFMHNNTDPKQQTISTETLQLLPPRNIFVFLGKILDTRRHFYQFTYDTDQHSSPEAAKILLNKMDDYCKTGFMSAFDTRSTRNFMLCAGLMFAFAAVYIGWECDLEFYLKNWFFLLILLSAVFLWWPLKDICLERKSRKK